jgi:hypothetical protein
MSLCFAIQETIETEFFYGFYEIFILGGFDIKTNPDFYISIVNLETNEAIPLTEKFFKKREYKQKRRAVKFYSFQINEYGKFKIAAHNYQDIVVRDYMLKRLNPFEKKLPLNEVAILIA